MLTQSLVLDYVQKEAYRRYSLVLTFPAVSITVLPVQMKEFLLKVPVELWRNWSPLVPVRLLAGLCSPDEVPSLDDEQVIELLEQDLRLGIRAQSDTFHLTDSQVEFALSFCTKQRDELTKIMQRRPIQINQCGKPDHSISCVCRSLRVAIILYAT